MKLTNKVTNLFFAFFAAIGLFMPIVGFKTMLMGQENYDRMIQSIRERILCDLEKEIRR